MKRKFRLVYLEKTCRGFLFDEGDDVNSYYIGTVVTKGKGKMTGKITDETIMKFFNDMLDAEEGN